MNNIVLVKRKYGVCIERIIRFTMQIALAATTADFYISYRLYNHC